MIAEVLGRGLAPGDRWRARVWRAPAVAAHRRAHPITRWALYLYIFSIPLEYPDRTLAFDVATLIGGVFLLATAFSPRVCYARIPPPLAWYWGFLYVWVAAFALSGGHHPGSVQQAFLRLLQLVLILWASANLMRDEKTRQSMLIALSLSCLVLAALQFTQVANAPADFDGAPQRATVLGQNPNRTGRFLAGAVLGLIGISYGQTRRVLRPRWLVWPLVGLIALAMVQGGSRGAMLSLAIGMLTFALAGGTIGTRVRNSLVGTLVVGMLVWIALQSPLMQKRFEQAESGNLAGREQIFPTAFEMFLERPLLGWGPVHTYFELASRLPEHGTQRRDTHNLVLELLTSTGLAGTMLCLTGLGQCSLAAWRAHRGPEGALPLALMASVLVGNMSGNFLTFKLYWIFQAYAVGSALALQSVARNAPRTASLAGHPPAGASNNGRD